MNDLDKRIAELEAELFNLRAERRKQPDKAKARNEKANKEGFVVIGKNELSLDCIPGLAQDILDELPVQIFIKIAEPDPERGRKYLYMNKTARDVLGWNEEEVLLKKFDTHAFVNGKENPEWRRMFDGETETLKSGRITKRERSWTAKNEEHGEVWRINRVDEIPIFSLNATDPIALCALAEDIHFKEFILTQRQLRRVFRHEYFNYKRSIKSYINIAERNIKKIFSENDSSVFVGNARTLLKLAKSEIDIAADTADVIYEAFARISGEKCEEKYGTVGDIVEGINKIYEPSPYNVYIDVPEDVQSLSVRKSEVIKGVLIELIRNAIKHTDRDVNDKNSFVIDIEIPIKVKQDSGVLVWEVSNKRQELNGRLEFSDPLDIRKRDFKKDRFGGELIGDLIYRAYGLRAKELIEFPTEPTADGWVVVKLECRGEEFYETN